MAVSHLNSASTSIPNWVVMDLWELAERRIQALLDITTGEPLRETRPQTRISVVVERIASHTSLVEHYGDI